MAYKRALTADVDRAVALDAFRRARAAADGVAPPPPAARVLAPNLGPGDLFVPPPGESAVEF